MKNVKRLKFMISVPIFLIIMTACVGLGNYIFSRLNVNLSPPWGAIATFWEGIIIFFVFGFFMHKIALRNHKRERKDYGRALLAAMERISTGDFSVLVEEDEHDKWGLAKAVNEMAQNLGSLETMRQDFISDVSHEIQSPLTSIQGFAALLRKKDDAETRRYAEIIENESKRLSSLSDNLLKLSALDNKELEKRDFRLDKQMESIALMLEPQWSAKRLTVEAELAPFTYCGDMDLLSQVWVNLLHNAIKFTPKKGRIHIKLQGGVVKIKDSGIGIKNDDQIHIFERFYKADKSRDRSLGGNGLGLSIVKKIVELHGGSVEIASKAGVYTEFTVNLI
ncbi:MAG: HAMP domain-containing histidine kinase [Clostridiales bacterium]|jgi:signal transduction histidine kinase|nr:HAMP domain-containing histidine kinase [Clostridiales bacterium]